VKDAGFDCEWMDAEDASLLRGVYKHGAGNWDAIRMDAELNLSEVRYSAAVSGVCKLRMLYVN